MADGSLLFDTKLDSSGLSTGLSKLGGVAKKALGATTAAIGAGVVAAGALVTAGVQGYAEYEQLVGGVDTLFKDSSQKVQEYADNAYKTAGLSANAYMETVTSFSASLLQSLDGDTNAAAEKADQAITDMSDNANKMGTDIGMIQNAYQGFAKQNYTMLDNLKLGYGGTKEEMARLLEDAGEISGIKYDISSYADVVDAIHVMQDSMGIAGTTAKEASTTIEGSVNATKAAWSNLLVGIADDNQDFDQLVDNFVDSAGTAFENILPRVETAISGVGQLIESLLPVIVAEIPTILNEVLPELMNSGINLVSSLVSGMQESAPEMINGAISIIEGLANGIMQMLPMILQLGLTLLVNLATGIAQSLPTLIPSIVECVLTIVDTLLNNIDMLIDAAIQLIMALATGLISALPILIEKAPEIIEKLVQAIARNLPKLLQAGVDLLEMVGKGLIKAIPSLIKAVPDIVNSLVEGFASLYSSISEIGGNIVEGIWDGISDGYEWIKGKIEGWVGNVLEFFKKILGIHSPSKVMRDEIGKYMAQGIAVGFEDNNPMNDIENSIRHSWAGMQNSFNATVASAGSPNYGRLGDAMADALVRSGLTVKIGDREFGRVVRSTVAYG